MKQPLRKKGPTSKRGPRAEAGDIKEEILAAARTEFGRHGFEKATLRSIADGAGVDVALVSYYFGSKAELFIAALDLPLTPASVLGGVLEKGLDGGGERMLRAVLAAWDDPVSGSPMAALSRSISTQSEMFRDYMERQLVAALDQAIEKPDSKLRATAFVSQLTGLTILRYIVEVEPLASASHDEIVELIAPNLQRYLTG